LTKARESVTNLNYPPVGSYYWRDGQLYRHGSKAPELIIVLPEQCRTKVLELAHSIPLAGHLDKDKTRQIISKHFFWLTLCKDVDNFCHHRSQCQKSSKQRVPKAPLMPLPIVITPFQKIAMNIFGPLPRSHSGNHYV